MNNQSTTVSSFWQAIAVPEAEPPYNTIHLKIFYPSDRSSSPNPFLPALSASNLAPLPIVIFFNGFNCSLASYQWLAVKLAARGLVVVLFDWLISTNKTTFLTPGVDLSAFSSETYGTMPSASALPLIMAELDNLQENSVLSGSLDLQKIMLGGHSAGGRLALENAEPKFFDRLVGAFSYGAHSAAPMQLGHPPGTFLPLPDSLPILILGGTEDGVIANNSNIYGVEQWDTPATPVIETFRAGIGQASHSCLVIIEGANHFAIANCPDPTLAVAEADFPATQPAAKIHSLMANIIGSFINTFVLRRSLRSQFELLLNSKAIALSEFK